MLTTIFCTGYGFVRLEDSDMNEVAIASLHETEVKGRVIRVEYSRGQREEKEQTEEVD